ncbi:FRG domain-containing protein [Lysinibacillus contaminans]|uniref:FRG domain-containing protein n=1 Tax=Lysinibacillus contaminans TaxID=1293441 RepID=UPI0006AEB32D|nr:FRG domain-containing protein [Lysinibacillus contaminans]
MEMVKDKVTNIEEFFKQLPSLDVKIRENIFYRGQSKTDYKLTPSILRNNNLKNENKIYSDIMTECSHEFEEVKLHNEILSKMQHYGVYTRLLDVTVNALVALYFACENNKDEDGAVFVIRTNGSEIKQFDSDVISILSSLPRFKIEEKKIMKQLAEEAKNKLEENVKSEIAIIQDFNEHHLIKRLLHEIKKEKPAFENIINPCDLLNNYFFIPRKNNARIIRQSGAFMIFGLGNEEFEVEENADRDSEKSYKIIIDRQSKREIIDQLSICGISKATLHPELYKVAEFIKEKYNKPEFY